MRSEVKLRHRALINEVQVTKSSFVKHFQNATKKKKKIIHAFFSAYPFRVAGVGGAYPKKFQ